MLHFSKSFQLFIEDTRGTNKISEIIYKIGKDKTPNFWDRRNILTDAEINYITNRQDGTISYLPKGKPHILTDAGTWAKQGRQNGKPAKVIRKIFTERFLRYLTDSDFEAFANQYKSNFALDGYKFEIVKGDAIARTYRMDREEGEASLNSSCMRDENSSFFNIYTHCEQCSILRLISPMGLLAGRALLWEYDDMKILDRIYVSRDCQYDAFLAYAEKNGFYRKKDYKSYDNKITFINPENGEEVELKMTIETDTCFDYFPYIDTFSYGDDGYITNDYQKAYRYKFNDTGGSREDNENNEEDDNSIWCERDGCCYPSDNVSYVSAGRYRDTYLLDEDVVYIDNNTWWCDDEAIVEINGAWYEKDDEAVVWSAPDGEYYLLSKCFKDPTDEEYYLYTDGVQINDVWHYENSEALISDINDEYRLAENCVEFTDFNGRQYWVKDEDTFYSAKHYEAFHIHPEMCRLKSIYFPIAPINFKPTI